MEPIADLLVEDDYDYDYDEGFGRKKRSVDLGFDPSIDLYPGDYCNIIQDLSEDKCLENSLLELFSEDNYGNKTDAIIEKLTQEDIIEKVNTETFSKVLGFDQDFKKYLGGITRDESGRIIGAKATFIRFFGKVNISAISKEDLSSSASKVWLHLIQVLKCIHNNFVNIRDHQLISFLWDGNPLLLKL